MDLNSRYMGLNLRNPLVASASPLASTVDGVRALADAGVAAVVLPSLFEEEVERETRLNEALAEAGTESFAESLSYFPSEAEATPGPSSAGLPESPFDPGQPTPKAQPASPSSSAPKAEAAKAEPRPAPAAPKAESPKS